MHLLRSLTLLLTTVVVLMSCSSDEELTGHRAVNDQQPMVFGTSLAQSAEARPTRAAQLEAGFKVSTWKNFARKGQQTVMDGYQVNYDATATPYQWDYVDVNGQPQRYWDLGAFPYEFRAVSPYMDGATIHDKSITLTLADTPFRAQTLSETTYNCTDSESEPCVVAHVNRQKNGSDYEDRDLIKNTEINTTAKANAVREVHMPFHHLISKVGFRLFIDDPQPSSPDYRVRLNSVTIQVVNADNHFIIASKTYTAAGDQNLGRGTFTDNTLAQGAYALLTHGEYTGKNLREHLNRETAFDLCPNYLQQIPQQNVQIRVLISMQTDHLTNGYVDDSNEFTYDSVLRLNDSDLFTWEPDTRYVYFLHIPNLHEHNVFLDTCEILPWDEVQTSDIIIEL